MMTPDKELKIPLLHYPPFYGLTVLIQDTTTALEISTRGGSGDRRK